MILYDGSEKLCELNNAVSLFAANGQSVMVQREIPDGVKYKQLVKLRSKGVEIIENNA